MLHLWIECRANGTYISVTVINSQIRRSTKMTVLVCAVSFQTEYMNRLDFVVVLLCWCVTINCSHLFMSILLSISILSLGFIFFTVSDWTVLFFPHFLFCYVRCNFAIHSTANRFQISTSSIEKNINEWLNEWKQS